MKTAVPLAALFCCCAFAAPSHLLPDAAAAFPANTFSLEYDALSRLRLLPNYSSLRKQYSGEGLQRAQKDLLEMGIAEGQLTEVVTAAGQNGFFGMLAGNFRSAAITKDAALHGIPEIAWEDGTLFCGKEGTCLLLPAKEEGRAFFGTKDQLKAITDVREGRAPSLETNATYINLKTQWTRSRRF